ncbi:NUDIX hydrolase [Phocaeicola abscessus]|uniref:NUDIX hydrolase n=1 Tax=Phocaeicola abscessus TaxID=555313 RepID=UPI000386580D|nr:NUDIX hydrolase [Phocaeicola abscessus]EPT33899.1 NUDIX domain protein [Bacteroidetes bacterium oral taxon 272 str. F0290]
MDHRDMKWETLASEYLIERPWLTARRDRVRLPTGIVNNEYYVLEYPDWVNVIAITKDGEFVFVRQYRYAIGETLYEICAGVVENGEEPLEAAQRELSEETGYAGGEWETWLTVSANASAQTNLTHCFLARGVEKVSAQRLDATEDIEVCLFSEEEMLRLLRNNEIKQALMAAPLWKYVAEKSVRCF